MVTVLMPNTAMEIESTVITSQISRYFPYPLAMNSRNLSMFCLKYTKNLDSEKYKEHGHGERNRIGFLPANQLVVHIVENLHLRRLYDS